MPDLASARSGGDGAVRPGSMTAVMRAVGPDRSSGPRWLRWAQIEGGRIVREEVRPPDRPLTVGASAEADVALPNAGFERRAVATFDESWRLHVEPGWGGRLTEGALSELGVAQDDGWRLIRLEDDARGRIELGDVALLVQLVDRPPEKRAPHLPASIDGGLMQGADWWFTAFVTASFFVHFGVVAFLAEMDWPVDPTATVIPARIASVIFPPAEPPDDVPIETMTPDDGAPADPDDAVADADDARPEDSPRTDRRPAERRASPGNAEADPALIAREVDLAVHDLIGAIGAEGSPMQDLLRDGRETVSQQDAWDTVRGVEVAAARGPMEERDRGCGAECQRRRRGIARLDGRGGTGPIGEGRPLEEQVVTVRPPGIDIMDPEGPVAFDPRELHRVLGARMAAVRRCYEHQITHGDPDLAGRLTVVMDVMPVGTLARVHGEDNTTGSDALEACVVRAIQNARVRVGPEERVTVRYPVVFANGGR